jgi:hypothetical protein
VTDPKQTLKKDKFLFLAQVMLEQISAADSAGVLRVLVV